MPDDPSSSATSLKQEILKLMEGSKQLREQAKKNDDEAALLMELVQRATDGH